MPSFGPRCLPSPNRSYAPRVAPVNSPHGQPDRSARAAVSSRRLPFDGGDATHSAARSLSTSVTDASRFEWLRDEPDASILASESCAPEGLQPRRRGRQPAIARRVADYCLARPATRRRASMRTPGRRHCRSGRLRSSGRGVRGACSGALRLFRERAVDRAVRHRSDRQPQGSARCFRSQPAIRIRSAGRLLRSQTDSDLRPVTGTARACFRTPAATRSRWSIRLLGHGRR
jgi:hypothetical protein